MEKENNTSQKKDWNWSLNTILTAVSIYSILSTLSKLKSWEDFREFIASTNTQIFEIFNFFGRIADFILIPWQYVSEFIFSMVPIRIPENWQDPALLGAISMWHLFYKVGNWWMKKMYEINIKKLDLLMEVILYDDAETDNLKRAQAMRKLIFSGASNFNQLVVGPPTNYLLALESKNLNIDLASQRNEALDFLNETKSSYTKEGPDLVSLKKYKIIDNVVLVIVLLLMVDTLREGITFSILSVFFKVFAASTLLSLLPFILFLLVVLLLIPITKIAKLILKKTDSRKIILFINYLRKKADMSGLFPKNWGSFNFEYLAGDSNVKLPFNPVLPKNLPLSEVQFRILIKSYLNEAEQAIRENNYAKAFKKYKKIQAYVEEPYVIRSIAYCLMHLNKYKKALGYIDKASRLDAEYKNNKYFLERGQSLMKIKNYKEAFNSYQEYIKINQTDYMGYTSLATWHALQKQKKEAINCLKKAIELGFSNIEHIKSSRDFQILKDEPEFLNLIDSNE